MRCRIKQIIKSRGQTLRYIAAQLEMDEKYFNRITNGHIVPNVQTLRKIAQLLGVYIDDLYEWEDAE